MRILFISIFLFLGLFACKESKETETVDRGYGYLPTNKGHVVEYEIISVNRFGSTFDTTKFFQKEVIGTNMVIGDEYITDFLTYKKDNLQDDYVLDSLKSLSVRADYGIRYDNNVRFVLLQFPVYHSQEFDVNLFNTSSEYKLKQKNSGYKQVNGLSFSGVVDTYLDSESNLIETIEEVNSYVDGVGLISRDLINITHQPNSDTIGSYYSKRIIATYQEN